SELRERLLGERKAAGGLVVVLGRFEGTGFEGGEVGGRLARGRTGGRVGGQLVSELLRERAALREAIVIGGDALRELRGRVLCEERGAGGRGVGEARVARGGLLLGGVRLRAQRLRAVRDRRGVAARPGDALAVGFERGAPLGVRGARGGLGVHGVALSLLVRFDLGREGGERALGFGEAGGGLARACQLGVEMAGGRGERVGGVVACDGAGGGERGVDVACLALGRLALARGALVLRLGVLLAVGERAASRRLGIEEGVGGLAGRGAGRRGVVRCAADGAGLALLQIRRQLGGHAGEPPLAQVEPGGVRLLLGVRRSASPVLRAHLLRRESVALGGLV